MDSLLVLLKVHELIGCHKSVEFSKSHTKYSIQIQWRTCAHATYSTTRNSMFRLRKMRKTERQRSQCVRPLHPSNSFMAASSWPDSYLLHARLQSRQVSCCSTLRCVCVYLQTVAKQEVSKSKGGGIKRKDSTSRLKKRDWGSRAFVRSFSSFQEVFLQPLVSQVREQREEQRGVRMEGYREVG